MTSYASHLFTKQTVKLGLGTFTNVDIPPQTVVMEMTGNIFSEEVASLRLDFENCLQIDRNAFQGPSGTVDDRINHSCDPNCFLRIVGNRILLVSLYLIRDGSELTFDYSTSSTDTLETWKMNCLCGSYKCRRVVSGFQNLSEELQSDYKSRGMVPMFLMNKNFVPREF